jgi:uncharacterized protein (TIGR02996 family)
MPTEQELLDAIDAHPDDDAPRLAHADWLEANGDPERAEFIRGQMAGVPGDAQRWVAHLPTVPGMKWACRRGYPEEVTFGSMTAFRKGWPLAAGHRVRHVVFAGLKDTGQLAALPELASIASLGLRYIHDDAIFVVLGSPHLGNLRRLSLELHHPSSAFLTRLAGHPSLERLHALHFDGPFFITMEEEGFAALAGSPRLLGLRELHIRNWVLGPALRALWRSSSLRHLAVLELHLSDWWGGEHRLSGLEELGDGSCMPALERFAFTGITNAGEIGSAVARATRWDRLRALNLETSLVGDAGAQALAAAPHLARLEQLNLQRCSVSDAGTAALAASRHCQSLSFLDLSGNVIGRAGVLALGQSRHLPRLRRLHLAENPAPGDLLAAAEARFRDGGPPVQEADPEPVTAVPAPSAPLIGQADEDALVRAIWADPFDEAARLVYADWLEDQGAADHAAMLREPATARQPLMERIRARMREDAPCRFELGAEAEGLVLVTILVRSLRTKAFERDGPAWLRRHHIAEVCPEGSPRDWSALFAAGWLAHTRGLTFAGRHFDAFRELAASPQVEGLASLVLGNNHVFSSTNTALFTDARMRGLCRLLFTSGFIRTESLRALAAAPFAPNLRQLALVNLEADGQLEGMGILGSPALGGLVTLTLAGGDTGRPRRQGPGRLAGLWRSAQPRPVLQLVRRGGPGRADWLAPAPTVAPPANLGAERLAGSPGAPRPRPAAALPARARRQARSPAGGPRRHPGRTVERGVATHDDRTRPPRRHQRAPRGRCAPAGPRRLAGGQRRPGAGRVHPPSGPGGAPQSSAFGPRNVSADRVASRTAPGAMADRAAHAWEPSLGIRSRIS